jgi:hypothetical protein
MKQPITGAFVASPFGTDYLSGIGTGISSRASDFGDLLGAEVMMPVPGTIRKFRIRGLAAQTGVNTQVFTYLKNGVATSITVTLNAASGTAFVADLLHEVHFAAGDTVALRRSGPSGQTFEYTLEFEGDDPNVAIYSYGGSGNDVMGTGTEYQSVFGGGGAWAPQTQQDVVAVPGTIIGISHNFSTAPGGGKSRIAAIMLTGTAQDGAGGTLDSRVIVTDANVTASGGYGAYATIAVPIVALDRLAVRYSSTGGPTVTGGGGVIAIQSAVDNTWNLGGDSNQSSMIAGGSLFNRGAMLSSVEAAPVSSPAPLTPFDITGVTWATNNPPGLAASGKAWTLEAHKDGAAIGSGSLISEAAVVGSVGFTNVPITDGHTFGVHGIASATAPNNTGPYWWTLRAFDIGSSPVVVLPSDPNLAGGAISTFYLQTFTAAGGIGGPYVFTLEAGSLPSGFVLSSAGNLSGFVTLAGRYVFTVRATDGNGNFGEREYTLDLAGIRILIDAIEVGDEIEDAEIDLPLNRQATATLVAGDGYIPPRAADVLIYARDGVTPLFDGLARVRHVSGLTEGIPANKTVIDCVDYSVYFDDALVSLVYATTQDLEDVVADIMAQALTAYGLTYTPTAPTGKTVPPIQWLEISVTEAFKRISDATGVVFRTRPIKQLEVFVPLTDPAPVTITDAEINAFDLDWEDPQNLPRNTVDLLCGPTGTGIVTQDWTADGSETSWEVDIQAVLGDAWPGARSHAFLGPVGAGNFSNGDTIGLGGSTYTMRAALVGDVAGEVLIGADINASLTHLAAAIIGAGGGVYAPSTPVNASADGYMRYPNQLAVNALTVGVAGDSIAVASSNGAIAFWYGEGVIPLDHLQLGSDPSGVAGWTQGYILENGALSQPLGSPGSGAPYEWDVTAGRGTVTITGAAPAAGTTLELKYLAVFPFHAIYSSGSPPITFREAHPEIINYAEGIALAQRIWTRESADHRQLRIVTDAELFLPGQALTINTTYRGGIVAVFLLANVHVKMINPLIWEYTLSAEESDEYTGSFVEQWKALTSGSSSSSSSSTTAAATPVDGGVSSAGDVYTDGRNAFRSNQSLGGHKLTSVADPVSAQDAATKAYADAGDALAIRKDGSVAFTGAQSMGAHKLTSVTDPTNPQDAATKAYVDTGDTAALAVVAAANYIKRDGSIAFTGDQSLGAHKLTNVTDPTNPQDAATKAYVDAAGGGGGGGGSVDRGFFGVGGVAAVLAAGPFPVIPTGTSLTFIVGINVFTGDSTVYANVLLTDLSLDDSRAVINRALNSGGTQHLFGLVHITGLTPGKEYQASLQYSSRVNTAAMNASIGTGEPFLICLNQVTSVVAATVETAQASSSATFTDLATAGPSATATIGSDGVAAVIAGDSENRVQSGTSTIGITSSGANTITTDRAANQATTGAQNITLQGGRMLSRLAAGSTTFKLQYLSDGGSNTRYARWIAVLQGVFGGTPITFGISQVFTAQTTTSTSYAALATADSVTLTTGTSVLILFSINTNGSGGIDVSVAVDVSGATTIAAADGVSNAKAFTSSTASAFFHIGRGVVLTVNAGSNTFALRYKVSSGTGTFSGRVLAVIRLN